MTGKNASQRTQALMAAIGQCSIAARVQTCEPVTVDARDEAHNARR